MDITSEQLRWLREQRKMTREELAKELDCSASAIVHWEGGTRAIPSWVADKMFAKLPITFTVQELTELYDLCREESFTMSELIQESVRALIAQHKAAKTSDPQKIIPLPGAQSVKTLDKAAEDPRPYKTGTED